MKRVVNEMLHRICWVILCSILSIELFGNVSSWNVVVSFFYLSGFLRECVSKRFLSCSVIRSWREWYRMPLLPSSWQSFWMQEGKYGWCWVRFCFSEDFFHLFFIIFCAVNNHIYYEWSLRKYTYLLLTVECMVVNISSPLPIFLGLKKCCMKPGYGI